eukprot:gene10439-10597_t
MSVRYRGVTYRITYTPGPDGLEHFLQTLQRIGIKVASASQVTFLCRSPDTGEEMSLKGLKAFDAAAYCASITAAKRVIKDADKRQRRQQAAALAQQQHAAHADALPASDHAADMGVRPEAGPDSPRGTSWCDRRVAHVHADAFSWAFAFFNSKVQEERKARIERVNEQLREFYGPLLACVTATKAAYNAMVKQHSPDGTMKAFQRACIDDPDGSEAKAYRMWMDKVLQPLNEKAACIIAEHIDLLDAQHVVPELLQLVAHVNTMRVILHKWKDGETHGWSVISYPDKLQEYVVNEFARIKARQAQLLGIRSPVLSKL